MSLSISPLQKPRLIWSVYVLLIAALAVVCFGSLVDFLLDIHDDQMFRDNIAISEDITFFISAEKELITGRPIAALFKYLGYTLWGNDPLWCHLFVVFMHTIASILLAISCRKMGFDLNVSLVGGALFLLNVTHFEAVHWISALDYPLAMVWTLVALLCYIHGLNTGRHRWTWLFCASLALGLFSHISAIMLWPFCLYWTWTPRCRFKTAFRRLLPSGLVLLPLLPLAIAITQKESLTWQSIDEIAVTEDPWYSRFEGIRLCLWYLSRLFTTAHWLPLPFYKLQTWELYIGGVVLVGLLLLVWKRIELGAICAVWTLLFLLPFLMVSEGIVFNLLSGPSRYLYMATAGSSLLLSWAVQEIAFRVRRWGHYLYSVILIGLLVSSYIFLQQVETLSLYSSGRYYIASGDTEQGAERLKLAISRDRGRGIIDLEDAYVRLCQLLMSHGDPYFEAILEEALRIFPQNSAFKINALVVDSMILDPAIRNHALQAIDVLRQNGEGEDLIAQSYYNSGCGFAKKKEYERAVLAYGRSLEFALDRDPEKRFIVYADLSRVYYKIGDLPGAIAALQKAIAVKADDANVYFTLGSLYHTTQQFDLAVRSLRQAIERDPTQPRFHSLLGAILTDLDRLPEAEKAYRQTILLEAGSSLNYQNLGMVQFQQRNDRQALASLLQAIHLGTFSSPVYLTAAQLYRKLDQPEEALQIYRQLLDRDLHDVDGAAFTQIGVEFFRSGDLRSSTRAYRKALAVDDNNLSARTNLGWNLYLSEDYGAAIDEFHQALEQQSSSTARFNLGLAYLASGQSDAAKATYALGVEEFGAGEAERIGAVDDLRELIHLNSQAAGAREILRIYWHE